MYDLITAVRANSIEFHAADFSVFDLCTSKNETRHDQDNALIPCLNFENNLRTYNSYIHPCTYAPAFFAYIIFGIELIACNCAIYYNEYMTTDKVQSSVVWPIDRLRADFLVKQSIAGMIVFRMHSSTRKQIFDHVWLICLGYPYSDQKFFGWSWHTSVSALRLCKFTFLILQSIFLYVCWKYFRVQVKGTWQQFRANRKTIEDSYMDFLFHVIGIKESVQKEFLLKSMSNLCAFKTWCKNLKVVSDKLNCFNDSHLKIGFLSSLVTAFQYLSRAIKDPRSRFIENQGLYF